MTALASSVAAAYANTATRTVSMPMEARDSGAPSFGDVLETAGKAAIETVRKGEETSAQAIVGKASVQDVVLASTDAEVMVQTVIAMRDKVVQAYQEIMHMPI